MNFQWILLSLFLVAMISEIAKALTRPMHKNILNLISIPVAFLITYILQINGLFQGLTDKLVFNLEFLNFLGEESLELFSAIISTLLSPLVFYLVYVVVLFAIRIIHVNLLSKYIESRREKKEKRLLKIAIKEEKELLKNAIIESEERSIALSDALKENGLDDDFFDDYEPMDDDEIEDMVERRVRKERRAKKKLGYFKESKKKKALSMVTALVSGFLAFAIFMMPVFQTMDVLANMTEIVRYDEETPAEEKSQIYLALEFMDKHVVLPYENTFVYETYKSMGLVDLMVDTVQLGGRIDPVKVKDENGIEIEITNADEYVRYILKHTAIVATELTSGNPDPERLGNSLTGIIAQPAIISILKNMLKDKIPAPEEGESDDIVTNIKNEILRYYSNALSDDSSTVIEDDIAAITDVIVALIDSGLIADLIGGGDFAEIIADQDNLASLLGAMSGLSVYNIIMSSAFSGGVDMLAPMLGIPENAAGGYEIFVNKIVSSVDSVKHIDEEQAQGFKDLLVGASEYENIYEYLKAPLNILEEFQDKVDEFQMKVDTVQERIDTLTQKMAEPGYVPTEEDQQLMQDLLSEKESFEDYVEAFKTQLESELDEFQNRAERLSTFIDYYVNWMNVQKPFMLAGGDESLAALTMNVLDKQYVVNTDELTVETLLDMLLQSEEDSEDVPTDPESDSTTDGEVTDDERINIDEELEKLPFSNILKLLKVTTDEEMIKEKSTPYADLINYLIDEANLSKSVEGAVIDLAWVERTLGEFTPATDSASAKLLENLFNDENKLAYHEGFEYHGITVEQMQETLHFDIDENCDDETHESCDCWSDSKKKEDSKKLVDLIFTIIEMLDSQSEETEIVEAQGESKNDMDEVLGLLAGLGETFDVMSSTHSLGKLPALMLKGLLMNDMLSAVMTPSMLYKDAENFEDMGYFRQIDVIEADANDEYTYAKFMTDFVEIIDGLLGKLTNGGE